jgi:uncharacterized protein (TIGR03067 family)
VLEGNWLPVAAEVSGQALEISDLRVARLSFAEDTYAIVDGNGETIPAGVWELGSLATPRTLDLVGSAGPNAGRRVLAIIALDGDRLCIAYELECAARPSGWKHEREQLLLSITYLRSAEPSHDPD